MKTDFQQALCIAMTSFVILSAVIKPSEGKCAGRWAIHACWGGNGKRSDPSLEDSASNPSLLRQLLLRNRPVFAPELVMDSSSNEDLPPMAGQEDLVLPSSPYDNDFPSEYNAMPPSQSQSVNRLAALLKTLRTLQRENDQMP